jgi:hypothetical protein
MADMQKLVLFGNLQGYSAMLLFTYFNNLHMMDMSLFKRFYQSGMFPENLIIQYNVKEFMTKGESLDFIGIQDEFRNAPGDIKSRIPMNEIISNTYKNIIININSVTDSEKHEFFLAMDVNAQDIESHYGKSVPDVIDIFGLEDNTRRCVECGGEVDESTIGADICDICIQEM